MLINSRNICICLAVLLSFLILAASTSASDDEMEYGVVSPDIIGKLRETGQKNGRDWVRLRGKKVFMRSGYTLHDCGQEISPTLDNLQGLVGKDCGVLYEEVFGGFEFKRIGCACSE